MKASAILNNYQMGSYTHRVLEAKIVNENRLDKSHTQVVWDNLSKSDFDLLKRLIRNIKEIKL